MKLLYITLSLLLAAPAYTAARDADTGRIKFLPESRLASGKWVKIGVDRTGVFEISHSALRSMGFSDPERVAIFGRGGRQLDMNFTDDDGRQLYSDALTPMAVTHKGEKLYFYAQGSEEFRINTRSIDVADGFFQRTNKNIYSDLGYYFLTDTESPLEMPVVSMEEADSSLSEITYGYGKVSHEVDLLQNCTDTGQVFYGEFLAGENYRRTWDLYLPDAIPGSEGTLECRVYLDKDSSGSWSYGLVEDDDRSYFTLSAVPSSALRSISPQYHAVNVPGRKATLFVEMNLGAVPPVANLDYWTLTYRRGIPTLRDEDNSRLNQDMVSFPNMTRSQKGLIRIPGGSACLALDVTDPSMPRILEVKGSGADGLAKVEYLSDAGTPPEVVLFDPLLPQHQIKGFHTGYSQITNQNLHVKAAEGADLVIICIPQLKDVARRLGVLHEEYDGSTVLVATTDECYNEFSDGIPDPMAYRALVKAVYQSPRPCRNLLLLGPLYADARGVVSERHQSEGIIAYQSTTLMQDKGAHNANDIYGMMADNLDITNLHMNDMQVGVGVLPVRYVAEAETVLEKIERFMKGEDLEYYLNAFTNVGGVGNSHTHDNQAIQLSYFIDRLSDFATISTNLPVDAYGDAEAQRKLFYDFDQGRLVVTYFGHGSARQLNTEGDFFTAADIYRLRNKRLPFMAFAGCSLSGTDIGLRGMGESIVVSTPYGTIGTLLATRETWSGENGLLFDTFFTNLFRDGSTLSAPGHARALTLGEVFARTKTATANNNELGYQLICDPALILPVTTRKVVFNESLPTMQIGEKMSVSGYVANASGNGEIDHDFNGKAVVRLMEPLSSYISDDLCSNDETDLRVPVADRMMAMATSDVVNGEFSADFYVPASARDFNGETARVIVAVYDPQQRVAGGGGLSGMLEMPRPGASGTSADTYPPAIEHLEFDEEMKELSVRVSDDRALGYSSNPLDPSFRLIIDGREERAGTNTTPILDSDCEAYTKMIPLPNLQEGEHTARVVVKDAAGNSASSETTFYYNPKRARLAFCLRDSVACGSARLAAISEIPQATDIVILDHAGMQVRRERFTSDGFEWDLLDQEGSQVAPGLYKAYLIQTGSEPRKLHSALVDIPVVGQ